MHCAGEWMKIQLGWRNFIQNCTHRWYKTGHTLHHNNFTSYTMQCDSQKKGKGYVNCVYKPIYSIQLLTQRSGDDIFLLLYKPLWCGIKTRVLLLLVLLVPYTTKLLQVNSECFTIARLNCVHLIFPIQGACTLKLVSLYSKPIK